MDFIKTEALTYQEEDMKKAEEMNLNLEDTNAGKWIKIRIAPNNVDEYYEWYDGKDKLQGTKIITSNGFLYLASIKTSKLDEFFDNLDPQSVFLRSDLN